MKVDMSRYFYTVSGEDSLCLPELTFESHEEAIAFLESHAAIGYDCVVESHYAPDQVFTWSPENGLREVKSDKVSVGDLV